ncbi:glycoside hydrolase [Rhizoclosmatium globosum]|uniref:Glycoside hydrolase n=1 Tax=Rhizoclosmatium globosum TaxID=329046 RepID=A0A1Y2C3V6_9FUNG|nr:glycoside hydrolase [Rhizoclosmatium globosum]|eukprot:ORY41636.1 glycoside hydrolase [Rhizoclosmatium globosum]
MLSKSLLTACSFGGVQCSGNVLQQCFNDCGSSLYCSSVTGKVGCLLTPPATTVAAKTTTTSSGPVVTTSAVVVKSTTTTAAVVKSTTTTAAVVKTTATTTTTTTTTTTAAVVKTTTTNAITTTAAGGGGGIPNHKYKFITYWGQNSGKFTNGQNQLHLIDYCNSGNFDYINIAFLSIFGNGGGNPAKFHLDLDFFGAYDNVNGPVDNATIASFLAWGVKILLSLGGGVGAYSLAAGSGKLFAQTLHNSFFRGTGPDRPFGNAVLDGIDWDIEGGGTDANELVIVNQYLVANNPGILITAAPQCPYPDAYLGAPITTPNAGWSFINVQFYNNYCSLAGTPNFDVWAAALGPLGIPIVVGVPGSGPSAPNGGYVSASVVQTYMQKILADPKQAPLLYGVMTWDASSTTVSGMATGLRNALDAI